MEEGKVEESISRYAISFASAGFGNPGGTLGGQASRYIFSNCHCLVGMIKFW